MGEAKSAVSGKMLSNENYGVAVTLLKERFVDVQRVVNCHYMELIHITPGINSSKGLQLLYDEVEKASAQFRSSTSRRSPGSFHLYHQIKRSKDDLVQLEIQNGARNKWTVGKLRDLLNDYVSARAKAVQHGNGNHWNDECTRYQTIEAKNKRLEEVILFA